MGLDPLRVVGDDCGYDQCWRTDRIRPQATALRLLKAPALSGMSPKEEGADHILIRA